MRTLFFLLILSSFSPSLVTAQTVDELAEHAVRGTTGPMERLDTMKELLKRENGPAALAKLGLDPLRDPEVVHMTVAVLLDSAHAGAHMAEICRLLLKPRHALKVKRRISRHSENTQKARELVKTLAPLARGGDTPLDRRAAVIALGQIPIRDAVELIAIVWAQAKDAGVIDECRTQMDGVVIAADGVEAMEYLAERKFAKHADLMREVSMSFKKSRDRWRAVAERFAEGYFRHATHAEVSKAFAGGERIEKRFAAKRARALAEAKDYGEAGVGPFATELVDCLLKELDGVPGPTARELLGALSAIARDKALGDKGLPRIADIRAALARGAGGASGGKESVEFARGAISLLAGMGPDAAPALRGYAMRHGNTEIRTAAVRALGDLASKGKPVVKKLVGEYLAELLAKNPPADVRRQLLFSLSAAPSDAADEQVARLLFPTDPKNALDRGEVVSCLKLLGESSSKHAMRTLEKLARESKDQQTRLDAIEFGLLPKTLRAAPDSAAVKVLESLVRDEKQSVKVRESVLNALGARGQRNASTLLGSLAADAKLDAELRRLATAQRIALGQRLVQKNGKPTTAEDLAEVAKILREEGKRGGDAAALMTLARTAIAVSSELSISGGLCRTQYARMLDSDKASKDADRRTAWKDAADRAESDGLTDAQRANALLAYRKLIKGEDRFKTSMQILELAIASKDARRYAFWLDALDDAVNELKDRGRAEQVVARRPAGEFVGDLAARRDSLTAAMDKLPKAG